MKKVERELTASVENSVTQVEEKTKEARLACFDSREIKNSKEKSLTPEGSTPIKFVVNSSKRSLDRNLFIFKSY